MKDIKKIYALFYKGAPILSFQSEEGYKNFLSNLDPSIVPDYTVYIMNFITD